MLPDLFVVVLYQYNENLYQIINTANRSLKQKIYIEIYLSTFRFIFLFTSSLPFYNFLQVIGVVIGLGWVREEKERAPEGLTSDISLSSLAFEGNAFSETPYFQIFQGGKPSDARAFGARD